MASAPTLGPDELRDAFRAVATVLADHAAALDRLEQPAGWDQPGTGTDGNSSEVRADPVEGSGTDLARTFGGAVAAVGDATTVGGVAERLARGAAASAGRRAGRSAALVLEGMSESLRNADRLDAQRFAIGLELAAERLAPADDGCNAGCLPAVVASAADGALSALDAGADLADVVIAAADDGLTELERGPVANPTLVERGVVDASAAGFLLVLDVVASVMTGEPLPAPPMDPVLGPAVDGSTPARYRVTCRVEPNDGSGIETANWLESVWFELGELERFDSFGPSWAVSLVTAEPGAAIEALFEVGRARDLRVVTVPTGA